MWQLAEAKNRLSEIVEKAIAEGPQYVSKRGREAVVIVAAAEYRKLLGQRMSFREFLCSGPSFEGLDLARDRGPDRDPDL